MIHEKAKSKAQQKFMGMVHAYKKGELKDVSDEVKKAAESIEDEEAEKFASTKHKGLPEHVDEMNELAERIIEEKPSAILDENMMVPDWLADIPIPIRFKIVSGESLSMIRESEGLEGIDIEEAYKRLSPRMKGKPLSEFPNGKFKRHCKGERGVTNGHGTFMIGEKDFVKESSTNPLSDESEFVDNAAHGKPRKMLHGKERINPYVKKPKENAKATDGLTIKRKLATIRKEIKEKLKEYGVE